MISTDVLGPRFKRVRVKNPGDVIVTPEVSPSNRLGRARGFASWCLLVCAVSLPAAAAPNLAQQIQQREWAGDLAGARSLLSQAGGGVAAAEQNALFLERHGDPASRDAYLKWAAIEPDRERRLTALKQVVLIDVEEGRHADLDADLSRYREAGGTDLAKPTGKPIARPYTTVDIPGPLSGFARMAALSPDLPPEELLPALARNLTTNGFESGGNEALQQTEYLRLLVRYVGQARELQALDNPQHKIVVPSCDSDQTAALLKVLGYRMRGSCGSDLVLETVNPTRAFLTIDSGFPLTQLEQDLRANHSFELPYGPTSVPVLYDAKYWMAAAGPATNGDFLDAFMSEPSLCRLYLGLSHVDDGVAQTLRHQMPAERLRLYANVLDFYGGMLRVEKGAVVVPGTAKAWASMIGVSPSNPGPFLEKLLTTDDGWLMSYYDALMRMNDGPVFQYLTQSERLKRFYDALRGKITTPGPARPVFRSSTDLTLFTTSLYTEANGDPHIPGGLEAWRTLFLKHPHGKYDGKLTRSASSWKNRDDVLEALFALSRKNADNEPLHIFLALNDIDRGRSAPISAGLASRLIASYNAFGPQYEMFASNPLLSERSINSYLDFCQQTMHESAARADRMGSFQAVVELWRILVRQGLIAPANEDHVFGELLKPWADTSSEADVFDATRGNLTTLLQAATPKAAGTTLQEQWVTLLAGPIHTDDNLRPNPAAQFLRYFDAQQLLPLDAIFSAADHAEKGPIDARTAKAFAERMSRMDDSVQMRDAMTHDEKLLLGLGYTVERHLDAERKFSLDNLVKNGKDARSALSPFLRDTLVGFIYCHYAPAGSQVLLTNPMFVRMHDFVGPPGSPASWRTTEVASLGWPANAGGRLAGSLVRVPYALAQAEQNFLMPRKAQALIWGDMVPQLIMNVTVTQWNNVTPAQVRWVALRIRRGRNLVAAAALNDAVASAVKASLSHYLTPANLENVQQQLHSGMAERALMELPPSYLYALAADPAMAGISPDMTSAELATLAATGDASLTPEAIAKSFGTPKPSLTHSITPRLMYLRTLPTLMGYSSRLMAESWESNNLFYAALADEAGVPVNQLDSYVPDWNRTAIENIFATHLEDWPALIRSLNATADSVLHHNQQADLATPEN